MTTNGTITNMYATGYGGGTIVSGPDGALWYADGPYNASGPTIGRITTSGVVSSYLLPSGFNGVTPNDMAVGPDNALWFTTDGDIIGRLTTGGSFSMFQNTQICPVGITAGPDGNLWFANSSCGPTGSHGAVGRITTAGVITLFTDPTMNHVFDITVGPDGALWFTNSGNYSIGRITTAGVVSNFSLGPFSTDGPLDIVTGADGALWYSFNTGAVGRMTTSGTYTAYGWPYYGGAITLGLDGDVWFTGNQYPAANNPPNTAIGKISPVTSAPSITGTPPTPAMAEASYNFTFTLGGYPAPTTNVTSGSLPPGITLSSSGSLSGTPTTAGTYTATVTASNGTLPNSTDSFTIVVTAVPTISSVSFQGTEASPTIVINGTNFGTEAALGPANPPGCINLSPTGYDFGTNLWIQDVTANWLAGRGQACVGLTVVSYSDTQIVLTPGSLYSSYGWYPGDSFTMVVLGSSYSGTVAYPQPNVTQISPNFGPTAGGNTVTLTGTGFISGSTTVNFGANAASGVVVNSAATSITATAPAGNPGPVQVTVTTPNGTWASSPAGDYTYGPPGGSVTLSKTTALIGNYPEKVSGTGWQAHGDTTVTINQCATALYSAASCDAANQITVPVGTSGLHLGTFSGAVIKLAVGGIDTNGDTCGLSGSTTCYIVVVGNNGDATTSAPLGFTLPSFSVHKTTGVLGNSLDAVKATGIPIGDTVVARECDSSVSVPATVSSHCDAATQISGTAGTSGGVVFTPSGVTLKVNGAYTDTVNGSCQVGGTCDIGFTDSNNADIGTGVAVAFATPTVKVTKTFGVLGNYVEKVTALGFPIGDTIDAVECDSSATTANLGQRCDNATQISGIASAGVYPEAAGEVTGTAWSSLGVTMLVDGAYSDGVNNGQCLAGGSCYVAAIDATNPSVNALTGPLAMATPSVTITPTTVLNGNGKTITVSAKGFPIGDTVASVECDTAFSGSLNNCDTAKTQISGTAGATGTVLWPPTTPKIPVLTTVTSTPYADSSNPAATCAPGDSVANNDPCFVYTYDVSNSAISNKSPFGVS
jgi:streptogramin lyase